MKINLKQWKETERAVQALRQAIAHAEDVVMQQVMASERGSDEEKLLMRIMKDVHEVREQASLGTLMQLHPQSEWMGGDSDNPSNHKLREPNCCPMPRRYFTAEEVEEAGAVCFGPVHWKFSKKG